MLIFLTIKIIIESLSDSVLMPLRREPNFHIIKFALKNESIVLNKNYYYFDQESKD